MACANGAGHSLGPVLARESAAAPFAASHSRAARIPRRHEPVSRSKRNRQLLLRDQGRKVGFGGPTSSSV
jgi:hypothetical protein